jgi:hypothetical protein
MTIICMRSTRRRSLQDGAPRELLEAAVGRYALGSGDEYSLAIHRGRLRIDYAHYPPALAIVSADGSFLCPYLFGMRGRIERQPGRPASALALSVFGQEVVASRIE